MRFFTKTTDGSFVAPDGRYVFISTERFISDIGQGECCFICGKAPSSTVFNKEHVLPNWILNRYALHAKTITVPGGSKNRYSSYVIPCCEACNTFLGTRCEAPIGAAIKGGWDTFARFLADEGNALLLYQWLALIFLKTHLKDKSNKVRISETGERMSLGETIDWPDLHHVHCIARAQFTGAMVAPDVYGTFFAFHMREDERTEQFDYADLLLEQTLMIRLGDVGLIAVMNDSAAAGNKIGPYLTKLQSVTKLQLRELFARIGDLNARLEGRPRYSTAVDHENRSVRIVATFPTDRPSIGPPDPEILGSLMEFSCGAFVDGDAVQALRAGRYTFFRIGDDGFFHRLDPS